MHFALCTAYFAVLLVLAMYGLHRSHLVLTVLRHGHKLRALKEGVPALAAEGLDERLDLPHVTIQLPLYNEATVAGRLLDHVAAVQWPRGRLEIQVLDDSIDETRALVRRKVEALREGGIDVVYIHRVDRTGYKAGALEAGLTGHAAIRDVLRIQLPDFGEELKGRLGREEIGPLSLEEFELRKVLPLPVDERLVVFRLDCLGGIGCQTVSSCGADNACVISNILVAFSAIITANEARDCKRILPCRGRTRVSGQFRLMSPKCSV